MEIKWQKTTFYIVRFVNIFFLEAKSAEPTLQFEDVVAIDLKLAEVLLDFGLFSKQPVKLVF